MPVSRSLCEALEQVAPGEFRNGPVTLTRLNWIRSMSAFEPAPRTAHGSLIWVLVVVTVGLLAAGALVAWNSPAGIVDPFGLLPGSTVLWAVVFSAVGLLIAYHRRSNPIGWLMLIAGALAAYGFFAGNLFGDVTGPEFLQRLEGLDADTPFEEVMQMIPFSASMLAATALVAWGGVEAVTFLVILLFPDGRPPSWWGRALVWFTVAYLGLFSVPFLSALILFRSGRIDGDVLEVIIAAGGLFGLIVAPLVGTGFIVRYRRSTMTQRLQLKWLLYGVMLVFGLISISALSVLVPGFDTPLKAQIEGVLLSLALVSVPIVIAIAILRHRVYDIDLVMNRTLVYGSLTVLLGAVYLTGVIGLPRLLLLGEQSDLITAVSTLAVAGLFNPMRRRVQGFVDRKFYRSRYDARKTVDAFAASLLREAELRQIQAELTEVVSQTVQPATVGVWVKGSTAP